MLAYPTQAALQPPMQVLHIPGTTTYADPVAFNSPKNIANSVSYQLLREILAFHYKPHTHPEVVPDFPAIQKMDVTVSVLVVFCDGSEKPFTMPVTVPSGKNGIIICACVSSAD